MKFINTTGNSIYLEDIDTHISFSENREVIELDSDTIKKSANFQQMAAMGAFEIVEAGESRIEQNLLRIRKFAVPSSEPPEEERLPSGDQPEIIIKGHFYEAGGYAKVNRNLAWALAKAGCRVEIKPITTRKNNLNELEVGQMGMLRRKVGSHAIRIDSIIPSFSEMSPKLPYRILYTTIESTTIPKQTVDVCNGYDEVWVTSDFCKDVLVNHGVKRNILVFPCSVNTALYHENHEPHAFRPELKKFTFLSVFGWSYRKGYDALLRAYLREFSGNDDVSLLIVSRYQYASDSSKFVQKEIEKFIGQYGGDNPAHIARCGRVIPEYEMPKIYRACNAFVLPTRGEGFGLPFIEASLCGLPVIGTNHSGQTMFLKADNSYTVDIDRLEKISPGRMHVHYWDNQTFPALNTAMFLEKLGKTMREVHDNYDEAKKKNEILQKLIKTNYSCESVAIAAKNKLDEIWVKVKEKKR